jgi:LysM repeat protein
VAAATAAPAAPAAIATAPARSAGRRTHVVTKGDTVFNIAKRYGFTAEDIAKANSLDSEYRIRMGQQLRIPVKR